MLALVLAGASGMVPAAPSPGIARAGVPRLPNVLIVVTDDHRPDAGAMRVMEETRARLGDSGRRLARSYATTPLCCPSRASILTGQYAHNHRVRGNNSADELNQRKTLEFNLRRAGYSTAVFGKFLNLWEGRPPYFDRWAIPHTDKTPRYEDEEWNVDGTVKTVPEYSTDWLADLTVDYLESTETRDGRPWFAYVSPLAPHAPYTPAERHRDTPVRHFDGNPALSEQDKSDKPPYVRDRTAEPAEVERVATQQLRTLLAVDELVMRLDEALSDLDERRNTLVFFLGDNGYTWGEHGLLGSSVSKNTPYTPSIRIPMLMRWPRGVPSGSIERRFTANIDVAPTIYDAANMRSEIDHRMDGHSLLRKNWGRKWMFLERFNLSGRHEIPEWASVRSRKRQYVEYYGPDGDLVFREFYDLAADPYQLRNLLRDGRAGNDPETSRLHRKVRRLKRCAGSSGPNPCP